MGVHLFKIPVTENQLVDSAKQSIVLVLTVLLCFLFWFSVICFYSLIWPNIAYSQQCIYYNVEHRFSMQLQLFKEYILPCIGNQNSLILGQGLHVFFVPSGWVWQKQLCGHWIDSFLFEFTSLNAKILDWYFKVFGYKFKTAGCSFSQQKKTIVLPIFSALTYSADCSQAMESTPPSSKRMKTRAMRRSGKLESWFSSDPDLINKYLHETSRKVINTPKVVFFNWMKE